MILTFVESERDGLSAPSAQALTMAASLGGPVEAVVFGDAPADDTLAEYRVSRLHQLTTDGRSPELSGEAIAQLVRETGPDAVLAGGTERGNELLAQAAARLRVPLAANCVALSPGDPWRLTRVRAGGMLLEDAELDAPTALATVAVGAVEPEPVDPGGPVETVRFTPDLDGIPHSRLVDRTRRGDGVTLTSARVIVSGGRGVGSAEGFAPLEELASMLGGAVGCSRVATNNGWRPHSDQVGQTGSKVNPQLYIACGISGATQHWVGCMGAKAILAINTDPQAPMVTRATYAVIGDVHEVLGAVIEEIGARSQTG